jgi:hypothetical protein
MIARALAVMLVVIALLPPARGWLEGSMARHMLLALPLLLGAGIVLGIPRTGADASPSPWNPAGIPGVVLALGCSAVLMVPRVLDLAVRSPLIDAGKAVLGVVAGAALARSWRALGTLGQAFVIGNIGWMLGAVGLLLRDAPERVCAVYLQGDQRRAGTGLVVLAVVVVAGWLATAPWRNDVPAEAPIS